MISDHLIPLTCRSGAGFDLSAQLLDAAGPFWRQSWKVKSFVAHVVGGFDEPLEHLLDVSMNLDTTAFDVDLELCETIAERYAKNTLSLPGEWYRELFRSKLQSIRVPLSLVSEAKRAYLETHLDHKKVAKGLANMYRQRGIPKQPILVEELLACADLGVEEAWAQMEELTNELLTSRAITDADISELILDVDRWLPGDDPVL